MDIITGTDAINKMRELRAVPGQAFGIVFITCNLSTHQNCGQFRKIERCRLRTAMIDEGLNVSADHYLYFTDVDTDEPKQCFKKLIRKVCFNNNWFIVKWFE